MHISEIRSGSSWDRRTCAKCGPETLHRYGCCVHCDPDHHGSRTKTVVVEVRHTRSLTNPALRTEIRRLAEEGEKRAVLQARFRLSKSAIQNILATSN